LLPALLVGSSSRVLATTQPTASVIAQGVAALPPGEIVWRVVADLARPAAEAQFEERALGFAVAGDAPILLTDDGSGAQARLGAGEAAFVPEAIFQRRESLGGQGVPYLRIGLAPAADAGFTAGGDLVYASDPFVGPPGRRDLDLIRAVLGPDETVTINTNAAPTLLIVRAGQVEIGTEDAGSVPLAPGEVTALAGSLTITGAGEGDADLLLALVGAEVPAPGQPDRGGGQGAGELGQVRAFIQGCPAGEPPADATFEEFDAHCEEPLPGTDVNLRSIDDGDIDLTQPTETDADNPRRSRAVWRDVPPGDYSLATAQPAGYRFQAAFCRMSDDEGPPTLIQNPGFRLAAGEGFECYIFFQPTAGDTAPPSATGAVYLQVFACPEGVSGDDLPQSQDDCAFDLGAMELFLTGDGLDGSLSLADAAPAQNAIGWTGLPLGEYFLGFAAGAAVVSSANDADALGDPVTNTATSYPVRLTEAKPEVLLQVYRLEFAPLPNAGSLTIQVLTCPPSMTPQSYDPAGCAPAEPAVGVPLVTSPEGAVYVFDVRGEDGRYAIDILPYGIYFVGLVDSNFWVIDGLPGDSFEGGFPPIEIGTETQDVSLTILNFPHLNP
jgi:hypothetical protein